MMAIVQDKSGNTVTDQSLVNDRFEIVPNDTAPLPAAIDAIIVGTGGTVAYKNPNGAEVTVTYEAGGPYFIGQATYVMATGTSADDLIGIVSKALR